MNMYFIALIAPEKINLQVLKWKNWMKENFGCGVALKSPAHITLVPPFWMESRLENKLIGAIAEFSGTEQNQTIELNNFSHFKPRVIFIDIIPNESLTELKTGLLKFLQNTGDFPLPDDQHPFTPHITIATRDLYKKAFYEAWEHFKDKQFREKWEAEGISLLRHNQKNWDVVSTSRFNKIH